jgi:hypothetical protein
MTWSVWDSIQRRTLVMTAWARSGRNPAKTSMTR